jgi:hypothetical protein
MSWFGAAEWWVRTIAVGALAITGLLCSRRRLAPLVVIVAALAIIAAVWQQRRLGDDADQLRELSGRLEAIGQLLPHGAEQTPNDTYNSVAAAIGSLNSRIKDLEDQIGDLQQKYRTRTIDDGTAAKLQDYLRQFGGQRIVVSCALHDVEAYNYADRIATILRAAGWDAPGPETTAIFGDAPSVAVTLYVRPGQPPDTVKILAEAFSKFNIPNKSGLFPAEGVPETAAAELFVPSKP